MLEGSRQKRIFDYALKRKQLDSGIDLAVATINLSEASRSFYEAYKNDDMPGVVLGYLDYVFWLRVEQAKLIATPFGDSFSRYKAALEIINGATNQGFLMLELLAKVVPVGQLDLEMGLDYVIDGYEKGIEDVKIKELIGGLIFGADVEKEE